MAGLHTAGAQDPTKAFPQNYQTMFENTAVSVIRVHYGPHEKVGVHDHSAYPTVYVYLSDSPPVRFSHDEQPPFAQTRPPIKAGALRVSPGRRERHSVENLGDGSSDFLRVELKQVPLGGVKAFRGEAPWSLAFPEDSVPVRDGPLKIERVVCTADPCPVLQASAAPSLVVAMSPLAMIQRSRQYILMGAMENVMQGEVRWLLAGEHAYVRGQDGSRVHLLRITVGGAGISPGEAK